MFVSETVKHRLLILVALSTSLTACPSGDESNADPPNEQGSAEPEDEPSGEALQPVVIPPQEELVGADMPALDGPQPCASNDECRVVQPSDWSPAVECCYDYPCSLDYLALNADHAELYRAWQRANPFDCAEFSREVGPCSTQAVTCGLAQEPPQAACVEGMCQLALPDPWPAADPEAQTCGTNGDCVPYRTRAAREGTACCADDCVEGDWIAISRTTRDEFAAYIQAHQEECGEACPDAADCAFDEPHVTCEGGYCVLE